MLFRSQDRQLQDALRRARQAEYQTPNGSPVQTENQSPPQAQMLNTPQPQQQQLCSMSPQPPIQQLQMQIPLPGHATQLPLLTNTVLQQQQVGDRLACIQSWAAAGMLGSASALIASVTTPTTQRVMTATTLKLVPPQQAPGPPAALSTNPNATSAIAINMLATSQSQDQTRNQATTVQFASPLQQVLASGAQNYMFQPIMNPQNMPFQSAWDMSAFAPVPQPSSMQGERGQTAVLVRSAPGAGHAHTTNSVSYTSFMDKNYT